MILKAALKFGELDRDLLIRSQGFAHSDESPDHKDAHLDGQRRIQHCGSHDCAVFGKGVGQVPPTTAAIV